MRRLIVGMAALGFWTSIAAAHETRLGEDGFTSPPAQIADLGWLVGQWEGVGIAGAPAMESWLPPAGGTMVGSFVQTQESEDGARSIRFTEHMYIVQSGGSLVLWLKHFNADLTGWEEKDEMASFRLLALEPCAAFFHALTLRCADPDNPGSGLVTAVRMRSDSAEPRELVFRFDALQRQRKSRCDEAITTIKINECLAHRLETAADRQVIYRQAAIERHGANADLMQAIIAADAAHRAYSLSECDAVNELWRGGSIRTIMALTCRIALTDQRTHAIWQNWLADTNGSAPGLPEPQPTR